MAKSEWAFSTGHFKPKLEAVVLTLPPLAEQRQYRRQELMN